MFWPRAIAGSGRPNRTRLLRRRRGRGPARPPNRRAVLPGHARRANKWDNSVVLPALGGLIRAVTMPGDEPFSKVRKCPFREIGGGGSYGAEIRRNSLDMRSALVRPRGVVRIEGREREGRGARDAGRERRGVPSGDFGSELLFFWISYCSRGTCV